MPTIQLDDLSLYYQERGEGTEPVLALHPSTVTGTLFTWAIPRSERYRVIVPDQRGHGKTPNPAPDLNMPRLVQDMINLMDALGIEQFHAMGYSMGAAVVLGLSQLIPERLKSVVIIGASHRKPNEDQQTAIAGPPENREGLVLEVMHPERGTRVGWSFDVAKLEAVKGRTGIIVGDRDPIVPLSAALELYDALPYGELLVVPNAGHFDYHSSSLVRQYLKEFFGED